MSDTPAGKRKAEGCLSASGEVESPAAEATDANAERALARKALTVAVQLLGTNVSQVEEARRERDQALELLDAFGNMSQKWNALVVAASRGKVGAVTLLLAEGVDVDGEGEDFCTALMAASRSGPFSCVVKLLAEGADVRERDSLGHTALHHAAMGDADDADPHSRDRRAVPVVRVLLEAHLDKLARGCDGVDDHGLVRGKTALQVAEQMGHHEVAKLLRDYW